MNREENAIGNETKPEQVNGGSASFMTVNHLIRIGEEDKARRLYQFVFHKLTE